MIVPGSSSQLLAAALAEETGRPLATPTYDRFPDGETLAAVPDFDGEEAVVVAATDSDEAWVELLQLQDAVREAGAERVTTVVPYMGYARQDQSFGDGEPVSARAMARAVSTGTDRVVLVNPHEPGVADFYDVPVETVDAAGVLAGPLPADLTEPLFLAPDEGAVGIAETVRDAYGAGETDYFEKHRDRETGAVAVSPSDAAVSARDVVVVDDIVATGSTMSESVAVLNDRGAGAVLAACVHPMLAANAVTKLRGAGVDRIVGSDTIEGGCSVVSVAPVLADALA
ncbi:MULTISPECIES: ribose-phosphate diphosphokinase [unclassified Halorubrum]|uniref:ribose-phosphate diphosphokinase n=1 Tax=unclassified Halorubrum TaxID=2642239 RepID=UPI000B98C10C|nr:MULTISPECIES: ribose-phosphate diphosphokinase [unclassified Halorubrum]OYR40280.1 ribose-phosphate pyrophosphokinase [Halorubrum sp. Eb13]OYR45485.1 ribose-phosphate pyrophosphokinase [Halorubrum sp. Hd13]OYR50221.1 ribose-phosphate pyrophosphokinase [Halorubrum sp. Ea8]OYR53176.1 ribose-phosphate pyrophosphokinase [Halorubrum sp. Ea1]